MQDKSLREFRREFIAGELKEQDLLEGPHLQFMEWMEDAMRSSISDPNAMSLATADRMGKPSVRIVLLKNASEEGYSFFTNYNSRKGHELEENPHASIMFFWPGLDRQLRIEGVVTKLAKNESDDFFNSRPRLSQISSAISPQSKVVESRETLETKFKELDEQMADFPITRPSNWGGYILKPHSYEFWQGREHRLHDRIQYILEDGMWKKQRLAP